MIYSKNTKYAKWIHLANMVPVIGLFTAFIMWIAQKDEDLFINHHGREAIRFHFAMILWAGFIALCIYYAIVFASIPSYEVLATTSFIVLLPVFIGCLPLFMIVASIRAAIIASKGKLYAHGISFSPRRKTWEDCKYS